MPVFRYRKTRPIQCRQGWRPSLLLSLVLSLLLSVVCLQVRAEAEQPCAELQSQLNKLQLQTQQLEDSNAAMLTLAVNGVLTSADLRLLIPVELSDTVGLQGYLQQQQQTWPNPLPLSDKQRSRCQFLTTELQQAYQAYQQQHQQYVAVLSKLTALPQVQRFALERTLQLGKRLAPLQDELNARVSDDVNRQLLQWLVRLNDLRHRFIQAIFDHRAEGVSATPLWLEVLELPPVAQVADWDRLNAQDPRWAGVSPADWRARMREARIGLRHDVTRLRNIGYWRDGWLTLFQGLSAPSDWLNQLWQETRMLPSVIWDTVTAQSLHDYELAQEHQDLWRFILRLGGQLAITSLLFLAMVRLSNQLPAWLSRQQQRLYAQLDHPRLRRGISALFWLLKPNASWLFILILSLYLPGLAPRNWYLVELVFMPVGLVYALYRSVSIIVEWLLERMYGRTNQFHSALQSEHLAQQSRRFAVLVVFAYVSFVLLRANGGGRLLYLLLAANLLLLYGSSMAFFQRHRKALVSFLRQLSPSALLEHWDRLLQKPLMLVTLPLLFVAAQLLDMLLVLHEKLQVFDYYRRISTRLLRLRLETSATLEDDEEACDDSGDNTSYRQWFLGNIAGDAGIVRLEDSLKGITNPINRWFNDKSRDNVLVVSGSHGAGKSTLLTQLQKNWEQCPLRRIEVPAKTTAPEAVLQMLGQGLEQDISGGVRDLVKLDSQCAPQVVIVDGCHNLFLSEVGQLDGYRTFLQCINANLHNLFWVLVFHAPSWNYLNQVFRRQQQFDNMLRVPSWSAADIRKLILSRHQRSRMKLKFDDLLLAAKAGTESANFRATETRVFNLLWEQSGGNPLVALHLWVDAAQQLDRRTIEIGLPQKPAAAPLGSLSDEVCFVYAAIVIHENLSVDEMVRVTNLTEAVVRHALKQGSTLQLIERGNDGRYRIAPLWYGNLSTLLTRKNMLHG